MPSLSSRGQEREAGESGERLRSFSISPADLPTPRLMFTVVLGPTHRQLSGGTYLMCKSCYDRHVFNFEKPTKYRAGVVSVEREINDDLCNVCEDEYAENAENLGPVKAAPVTACISHIREHEYKKVNSSKRLKVFPGYVEVRNNWSVGDLVSDLSNKPSSIKESHNRGKITEFSKGSRLNLMKTLLRIDEPLQCWQDFTFADDVVEGLGIEQTTRKVKKIWKRFWRTVDANKSLNVRGILKWEWVARKSGKLQGVHVPHIHFLYYHDCDHDIFKILALMWVQATGTKEIEKSYAVATNPKSYRFIDSMKTAMKYVGKYVSKNEGFKSDESIGRSWGVVGDLTLSDGEVLQVTGEEMIYLRRIFRNLYNANQRRIEANMRAKAKKKGTKVKRYRNKNMEMRLRQNDAEFFMIVPADLVRRVLAEKRLSELTAWFGSQREVWPEGEEIGNVGA